MTVTADEINAFLRQAYPGAANQCVDVGPTFAVASITPDQALLRPGGFISGPTQFALADAVLWYALFGAVGIEPMALTSELSIRYLRPAAGTVLWGRADLHTAGRRNVVGSVRIWVDDNAERIVSVAQGTYVRPG